EEEMHERLDEAAAREEELRERLDEAAAREEELHERLDEAAARERALESKLSELGEAADALQRALDGNALAVAGEEDATAVGDRVVGALKRLRADSDAASATMRGARLLEGADAEPLLSQCRQMASEMEALRASEQRFLVMLKEQSVVSVGLRFRLEEMEERVALLLESFGLPFRVLRRLTSALSAVIAICALLNCDEQSIYCYVEEVLESRDYYARLCGNDGSLLASHEEDVTRSECVLVMKRAIKRLVPELLDDPVLRFPAKLQRAVEETVLEILRLRESLEESTDAGARVEGELGTILAACGKALCVLRGEAAPVDAGEGAEAPRPSVSYLARSLVSQAGDTAGSLRELREVCVECGGILAHARQREGEKDILTSEYSLTSAASAATDVLLLSGHCREVVAELLALREKLRSSLATVARSVGDNNVLLATVRSCLRALSFALDNAASEAPPCEEYGVDAEAVEGVCEGLRSCTHAVALRLREAEHDASASAQVLQEALVPEEDRRRGESEGLLMLASAAARALEARRVEVESVGTAFEQARRLAEEYRRCMHANSAEAEAAMTAQVQTRAALESQLNEATERQVQATAKTAKLLRDMSEFVGSVAAIMLYDGDAVDEEEEEARAGHDREDEAPHLVSRVRLDGLLEHCSAVMRALEAAKAKAKLLSSEADDLRGRLSESENALRELEYQSRNAETKSAAQAAEMRGEMEFLRDALQAKVTECEKVQQHAQYTERRVNTLQAEMANADRSYGSERDSLSKVQSSLLAEKEETRRQLEQLRLEQKEVQKFLHKCHATSLDEEAAKMAALAGDVALIPLVLEEAEHRMQLLQNWLLSHPMHAVPLLAICTRVGNVLSATDFEDIPTRVAEVLKREQEFGRLLGAPAKTPGPTRAAVLKTLMEWAEKFGLETELQAETFLADLDAALSELYFDYASLRKKKAALQGELDHAHSTLAVSGRQVEQIASLLRASHQTEGPLSQLTAAAAAEATAPSFTLQTGFAALRAEAEWAAERIAGHAEQTRKVLDVFAPVYSGCSVLEASMRTVEELRERRATEEGLRAELATERAKVESCRGCIETSKSYLPEPLIPFIEGDDLQRRCAFAAAELRRLTGTFASSQQLIASAGQDAHGGDLCMNLDDLLRKLRQLEAGAKVLEASCERQQQRALQLETTLRDTEERTEATMAAQEDTARKAVMQEKAKQNELQAQLAESMQECDQLRAVIAACGSAMGCSLEAGSGNCTITSAANNDEREEAKVVRAAKVLAATHDAHTRELEELKEQLASSRKALAAEKDLRALAQEEQCRLMDEVERLRAELLRVTASDEEHQAALLHLTERAEGVASRPSPDHSASAFSVSSPLSRRASLAGQRLLDFCSVCGEQRRTLEGEVNALKERGVEHQRAMDAVVRRLREALQLTGETHPGDAILLGELLREKLSEALEDKKSLTGITEALREENATLKGACTSTEAQLQEAATSLAQLDLRRRALEEDLGVLTAFAGSVAQAMGEPLPSGPADVERLKGVCVARQAALQENSAEMLRMREELNAATSTSAELKVIIDVNAAEAQQRTERLRAVEQERDELLKASEQLVGRVQSILDDHLEVQRELKFPDDSDDVTIADIVQLCVERLEQHRIGAAMSCDQLAALQRENAELRRELQRLEGDAAVTADEIAELHEQLRLLLDTKQLAKADQSKLRAEYDSLSRQVQALFTDALRMAADDMQLQLPLFSDTSVSGALQGLRSLLDYIAERFRSGASHSEDAEDKVESLEQLLQVQERQHAQEARSLYRSFRDHVAAYTTPHDARGEDDAADDDRSSSSSSSDKARRLLPGYLVVAGNSLHRVHTEVRHVGLLCRRLLGIPAEPPGQLRGMSLLASTAWLGEAASEIVGRAELLHNAIRAVSQVVEISPIDLASPEQQVTDWVESFGLWLERAQRGLDATDRLLEALTSVVHSHGGVVEEVLSANGTAMSCTNNSNTTYPQPPIVDASLQDLNNSRTDVSLSRYVTHPHHRAVFNAVQELLSQLESRGRVLTSEWQALMDQNNRLIHERRQTEEDQLQVQAHVQELRRVVQRKIEEDRRVEKSLQELDRHLDMQARELAMKYRSDHDLIVRQFTELRGTIRRTIKPQRSHSTTSTAFGSVSH
ncbi:uncharacterized protein Tco025E_00669, partial [Trypanosoma conorhini]